MKLEIRNITKSYGKFVALRDFSAELTPGVYGLLGPNGAGKTTLIKAIVGAHKINSGSILFNDVEISDAFLKDLGYLPQAPLLYDNYTARQFLQYMCVLKGVPKAEVKKVIEELLVSVNLEGETKKIGKFSGGMKQRLGIAQALINNPSVLILDEPTAGLDPRERLRFRNIISTLSLNKIVILATHIVSDIENIAKEIILLRNGDKLGSYSPRALIETVSPFVWKIEGLNEREHESLELEYLISNVKVEDGKIALRLLADNKPHKDAFNVEANIEDVYLHFFKEVAQ